MDKISGKIRFAGKMLVAGHERFGFFVECGIADVMELQRACLLNGQITITPDRRLHDRVPGPAFRRLPPAENCEIRAI